MIYILSNESPLNVVKGILKFPNIYKLEYYLYRVEDNGETYYITEVGYKSKDPVADNSKVLTILYTISNGIKEYCEKNNLARHEVPECLKDTIYIEWPNIKVTRIESLLYDSQEY